MFSLKDRVAIVTGSLGLIGKEHCRALAEAGAHVVATDLDEGRCKEFAANLTPEALGVGADVSDKASVSTLLEKTLSRFGRIDILLNNAAVDEKFENPLVALQTSQFEHFPLELWKKIMDVNVTGMFLCSQIIGAAMAEQGKGSIINVASTYGVVAPDQSIYKTPDGQQSFFKSPAYPVSKGAVISFTRFLASYWGPRGVRVNTLSPGGVENAQDSFFVKNYSAKTLLGRMAQPSDYRGAVVYLASDASSYMTGANLIVDGGWTAI
ncbi:MAG: SDR family oxidoreductase [Nitrospirae bacterium]|nr:SDR family oxidoreductase [Nitrospirota bacterium]